MCPFSWPSLWGRGMKNSLMSAVGLLFISCLFFRLLLSSILIIDGLFCGTGTAAWVRVGFDFFDFGVRSWPSILVSLSMVMGQAWGLLVVATGQSGKGDKPAPEFVGINISAGIDDPWTVAELGGTVQVRLGTKSLASLIYFAGGHMVQAGQVDIVMGSTGLWKTAFYCVQHGESVNPWVSVRTMGSECDDLSAKICLLSAIDCNLNPCKSTW